MKRFTPARSAARTRRRVATASSSSIEPPGWSRIAAARWTTVSTPRIALRKEAGLPRSPSAICTRTRSGPSRRGSRTRTRTGSPAATSRRRSGVPTVPVARRSGGSKPVPLFPPGVGVVVVAVELPEAHPVLAHHLELAQELRRLPEVALAARSAAAARRGRPRAAGRRTSAPAARRRRARRRAGRSWCSRRPSTPSGACPTASARRGRAPP